MDYSSLPTPFLNRMRAYLGDKYDVFLASYSQPAVRGLRVNTMKISVEDFLQISPYRLTPSGVIDEGFIVEHAEGIGRHPFHMAGLFYMQEPSAMSVIDEALIDASGLRVLDLCAAPGGKTGGIGARMHGNGILISNEIVPSRAKLLAHNIERLGIPNSAVICTHPDTIADSMPCYFDRVIVDAPCSGEGMFRKDTQAVEEWSEEHVASCAVRQRAILESACRCVADDGYLIYSTCTFSKEENEGVVEGFLRDHPEFSLSHMRRLYPHTCSGEGHFVARMHRDNSCSVRKASVDPLRSAKPIDRNALTAVNEFIKDTLLSQIPCIDSDIARFYCASDRVFVAPNDIPHCISNLKPLSIGVELGTLRKGRIIPSHTFFMSECGQSYKQGAFFPIDAKELSLFLSGNTFELSEALRGYSVVGIKDDLGNRYPLGFGKAVDGIMKNHLPKGLYI